MIQEWAAAGAFLAGMVVAFALVEHLEDELRSVLAEGEKSITTVDFRRRLTAARELLERIETRK